VPTSIDEKRPAHFQPWLRPTVANQDVLVTPTRSRSQRAVVHSFNECETMCDISQGLCLRSA